MFSRNVILVLTVLLFSSKALASGSYSGGDFSRGGSNYSAPAPKAVDQAYEYGKSIYFGRFKGKVVSYCINRNDVSSPVKRSSIRAVRGVSYTQLGDLLYNCENIEQTMSSILNKNQLNAVAYYLNKRYRLNLRRS